MAVVAPVLFLLIFALVEFARVVMVQHSLTNAAREGCRTATLASTKSQTKVDTTIRDYLSGSIAGTSDTKKVQVTITPADFSDIASNTPITCQVTVRYSDVSWLPPSFLQSVILQGSATMYRE